MGYNELELELRKVLSLIDRWRGLGYMPTIEQGVALERMQRAYVELLDMPCGEPVAVRQEEQPLMGDAVEWSAAEDHEVVLQGMTAVGAGVVVGAQQEAWADEGEDFVAGPVAASVATDDAPMAKWTDKEQTHGGYGVSGEGASDETGVMEAVEEESDVQTEEIVEPVGETEIPDEPAVEVVEEMALESESSAVDREAEPDAESQPEGDAEPVVAAPLESAPASTPEPVSESVSEVEPVPESKPESTSESVTESEPAPAPKPQMPRIFGLEVSPYTRHEIIDTLFHGNVEMFEAEETKINAMGSLEEALVYIGETYHWIPENAATVKFIDLLETRFDS